MPVGAYGGRREIMDRWLRQDLFIRRAPLSGNPLAMTAGLKTLKLLTPERYAELEEKGAYLAEGLAKMPENMAYPHTINRVGSMVGFFFTEGPVTNFEQATKIGCEPFCPLFPVDVEEGIYLPPSQFEGMFISIVHTKEDLDQTIAAHDKAMRHWQPKQKA